MYDTFYKTPILGFIVLESELLKTIGIRDQVHIKSLTGSVCHHIVGQYTTIYIYIYLLDSCVGKTTQKHEQFIAIVS